MGAYLLEKPGGAVTGLVSAAKAGADAAAAAAPETAAAPDAADEPAAETAAAPDESLFPTE